MPCFFPVKKEGKNMYLYIALLMQKGHAKCTVAPNEAYRPSIYLSWNIYDNNSFKQAIFGKFECISAIDIMTP